MVAAKTTHGRFAMSGAPKRLAQRFVRTFLVRARLTAKATILRAYLPAGMAARLDSVPEALLPPKHPSQVAFEALSPLTPGNCLAPGLGRRTRVARARLGVGGGVDGAAVVLRGRAAERLATRAETAAQAPWRAAIVAARALKCAVQDARGQMGEVRNDPMGGMAGRQTPDVRNDPIGGTGSRTQGPCNDPIGGSAGRQTPDVRNDPIGGTGSRTQGPCNDPIGGSAGHRTPDVRNDPVCGAGSPTPGGPRNDPIGGSAMQARAAGAPLDTRMGVLAERQAGGTALLAPGSPGLREALAREVEKRRLRAKVELHGNDPMGGNSADAHSEGSARPAPLHRRSSAFIGGENCLPSSRVSTRALALGSTHLARTWEPSVAEVLGARFGPAMVEGRLGAAGALSGIAAMPDRGGAQRPYMRPGGPGAGPGPNGGWEPVGR